MYAMIIRLFFGGSGCSVFAYFVAVPGTTLVAIPNTALVAALGTTLVAVPSTALAEIGEETPLTPVPFVDLPQPRKMRNNAPTTATVVMPIVMNLRGDGDGKNVGDGVVGVAGVGMLTSVGSSFL